MCEANMIIQRTRGAIFYGGRPLYQDFQITFNTA